MMLTLDKHFKAAKLGKAAYDIEKTDFRLDDFHIVPVEPGIHLWRDPYFKTCLISFSLFYIFEFREGLIRGAKFSEKHFKKPITKMIHARYEFTPTCTRRNVGVYLGEFDISLA